MKHSLIAVVLSSVMGLSSAATMAQDFDLTDMMPARPGQAAPTSGDYEVKDNVVVADDEATAVTVAHQNLMENTQDGVMTIAVGSGIGVLSTGSASYQLFDNPNASLLSKRAAYNQAFWWLKGLVEHQKGVNVVCSNLVSMSMDFIDSGTDGMGNESVSSEEACSESVNGSVAGYVTYDVFDDVDTKRVRVSVISTQNPFDYS